MPHLEPRVPAHEVVDHGIVDATVVDEDDLARLRRRRRLTLERRDAGAEVVDTGDVQVRRLEGDRIRQTR
jgi:hypothetical protein